MVKIRVFYSEKCKACPPTLSITSEVKSTCNAEIQHINIDTKEGMLKAMANRVDSTPTIDIDNKVRLEGYYPDLKEDILDSIQNLQNFEKRSVLVTQMEGGDICRIYVDEVKGGKVRTQVKGSEKCKQAFKGEF